jgi:DNA-binding NarL/FixJ family response regulator
MTLQAQFAVAVRREPTSSHDKPLPLAAEETAAMAPLAGDPGDLWQHLIDGRLVYYYEGAGPRGRYVVCRVLDSTWTGPLNRRETAVIARVLSGQQQKFVAHDLGIACSTASKWFTQAVEKLHLERGPLPLPIIVAAQCWASGAMPDLAARRATLFHDGSEFLVFSVPTPNLDGETLLTRAEREVAVALIEGQSRDGIALRRSTSSQTVACQLRGIFAKLDVKGRCDLIKRGLEEGWFR